MFTTLPPLTGTEKQIAYGEKIRTRIIESLKKMFAADLDDVIEEDQPLLHEVIAEAEKLCASSKAAWWINECQYKSDGWYFKAKAEEIVMKRHGLEG
jgi:hypothetical protein